MRCHVWGGRATCSIAYSLPATSHTLVTASSDCGVSSRFSSFSFVNVNESFGHTSMSFPVTFVSSVQWRARIPGLRSAVTSGMTGMKSSSSALRSAEILPRPAVSAKVLASLYLQRGVGGVRCGVWGVTQSRRGELLYIVRWLLVSCASIDSGSSVLNGTPESHACFDSAHSCAVLHRPEKGSNALVILASCE